MPAAIDTAVDVALWFSDQALDHNEYLQPQKLQRLLFLAQAYFAVAYGGTGLMPAYFVADEMGPLEPNIYKIFSRGRPDVGADLFIPLEVESFLISIWRRFGHHSTEHLTRISKENSAYCKAYRQGKRTEITLESMRLSFTRAEEAPAVEQVVRPKMMRSQTGKPVAVSTWQPGAKPSGGR